MASLTDIARDLKVLYHLVKPTEGDTHQERLENFYRGQATGYDRFRQRLLSGREQLYRSLTEYDGKQWVDLGGGTGVNFEAIGDRLSQFGKIYIVDLCPSLLEVARERKADRGWTNVEVIEADVTQFLPPEGAADIVTFSYSLTMIPDWFAAIEQAYKIIKPGGIVGVVDFYVSRKHPPDGWQKNSFFDRTFWPILFASDNVFLSPDRVHFLHHYFQPISFTENMARIPFLPGLKVPYYTFIGQK